MIEAANAIDARATTHRKKLDLACQAALRSVKNSRVEAAQFIEQETRALQQVKRQAQAQLHLSCAEHLDRVADISAEAIRRVGEAQDARRATRWFTVLLISVGIATVAMGSIQLGSLAEARNELARSTKAYESARDEIERNYDHVSAMLENHNQELSALTAELKKLSLLAERNSARFAQFRRNGRRTK